jgi:phage terminase small subunit
MAKRKAKPKAKPAKRTTAKRVQAEDARPFKGIPTVAVKAEVDEDAWGEDCLTFKQRLFVRFYVGEAAGNASKAARLAGYRDDNANSLKQTAYETLTKPYVQRAIARALADRFGSPEDVRAGIAEIASGNAADYLRPGADGKLEIDLERMAEAGALGLIHRFEEEVLKVDGSPVATIKRKVRLYDRMKALELLGKLNGQFVDRHEHSGEVKFHPITLDGDKTAAADGDDK